MIRLNGHKFIFVHIPKNAGNTVRSILRARNKDIEERTRVVDGVQIRTWFNQHLTYDEYLKKYEKHNPSHLFSFCFLRDPYDRFISIFNHISDERYLKLGCEIRKRSADLFLEMGNPIDTLVFLHNNRNHEFFRDRHGIQQFEFIGKKKKVKFIGNFSNFDSDMSRIMSRLDISENNYRNQKYNVGKKEHVDIIHNAEYKKLISLIYEDDIKLTKNIQYQDTI